jgi:hypothetical protein
MPWKFKRRTEWELANDQLRMELIRLRRELENKQGAVGRLELALHQRHQTIDTLRGKLEAARAACARLDQENDALAELVRLG